MIKHIRAILLSGVIVAASAQAAQTIQVTFPFRTPAGELPAGTYNVEVRDLGAGKYIEMHNVRTKSKVLFHANIPVMNMRGTEQPRVIFSCVESGCDLKRIWRSGESGFDIRQKKLTPAETERIAVVRIDTETAE